MAAPPTSPIAAAPDRAAGHSAKNPAELRRAAAEFESVFISQFLSELRLGFAVPASGSDPAEDPFASLLRDEYAKVISRSGGIGLADAVQRELMHVQEIA